MNNYKNYLPSKKFIAIIIVIVVFIALFFTVRGVISLFKNKKTNNVSVVENVRGGVADDNNNGIPNWEETLWGLNPKKDGEKNLAFILDKRKALSENTDLSLSTNSYNTSTNNEELTKEFFSILMSLQQSGNLDQASISLLSENVGQKVEAIPIPDIYTIEMIKKTADGETANTAYFNNFNKLLTKYENEDIGKELTIISQGLGSNDPQAMYAASTIATAYKSFGQELIKLTAPNSIAPIQLSLANNYEKTGQSLEGLVKLLSDPILGMNSLINYKKYSDALVSDLEKLSESLQ